MNRIGRVIPTLALLAVTMGCASMPTSSGVNAGGASVVADGPVGFIAAGPTRGQGPEEVVRGFLLAAQSGSTMPTTFAVAREYLSPGSAVSWRPGEGATVLDSVVTLDLVEYDEEAGTAAVRASGNAVARVTADGEYEELPLPEPFTAEFGLVSEDGNWRISELDDGVALPAQVFTAAYRYTRLYHPNVAGTAWVPDVRWFPQQTWRTNAVQALLNGPPAYLADAVLPAVPERAAVALDDVIEGAGGMYEVSLRGWLRDADASARAAFAAQVSLALTGGNSAQAAVLADALGPIPVPSIELPVMPRTQGSAVALKGGQLYWVNGRELRVAEGLPTFRDGEITALALSASGSGALAVVDRGASLWVLGADHPGVFPLQPIEPAASPAEMMGEAEFEPAAPEGVTMDEVGSTATPLLVGERLAQPSFDVYEMIWAADLPGPIYVFDSERQPHQVAANWLAGAEIEALSVAPEGARVAVVARIAGETRLGVAGVVRDEDGVPIGLAQPIEAGASVSGITAVAWQDEATLAVIGTAGGGFGVYQVGVGGLESAGGLPRLIPGVSSPRKLTAAVGSGNMLAIDNDSVLHLREATSLWPIVGTQVDLVAYPG